MSTLFGWTQSVEPKWKIWKNNTDTILTFNFTKSEIINVRTYVTILEKNNELYKIEKIENSKKDSLLKVKDEKLANKDSIILTNYKFISWQDLEYKKVDNLNKQLIDKYNKQKKITPYLIGGSVVSTLIICLLLK